MPPTRIIALNTRADIANLRSRVIPTDAEPEVAVRAEELLRAANPHLDFDRLQPGTVVVVPPAPELRTEHAESFAEPFLADPQEIIDRLKELHEALKEGFEAEDHERQDTLAQLKATTLRAVERDPEAKRALDGARKRLQQDADEAAKLRKGLDEALGDSLREVEQVHEARG